MAARDLLASGQVTGGRVAAGRVADGHVTDGHVTDGRAAGGGTVAPPPPQPVRPGGNGAARAGRERRHDGPEIATIPEVIDGQLGTRAAPSGRWRAGWYGTGSRTCSSTGCGDSGFAGSVATLAFRRHAGCTPRACTRSIWPGTGPVPAAAAACWRCLLRQGRPHGRGAAQAAGSASPVIALTAGPTARWPRRPTASCSDRGAHARLLPRHQHLYGMLARSSSWPGGPRGSEAAAARPRGRARASSSRAKLASETLLCHDEPAARRPG